MTNPNDPAFPWKNIVCHEGLTKREYFAAMAMQGLASTSPNIPNELAKTAKTLFAMAAIEMADALIAELSKEPK